MEMEKVYITYRIIHHTKYKNKTEWRMIYSHEHYSRSFNPHAIIHSKFRF